MDNSNRAIDKQNFDVIIIGGSYSGLSAAMALGRSVRNVLVIDSGLPCNRQTPHSHNFITHDGKTPAEILALAKQQVQKYDTVKFHNGLATQGTKTATGFQIATQAGEIFNAKKLIFATGIKDLLPEIEGFSGCWGISIVHCPYCHGYEIKDEITGILANGDAAMHLAQLVNNLTKQLSIFTNGKASFSPEQLAQLNKHDIKVFEAEIEQIKQTDGQIKEIIFKDGTSAALKALYAKVPFVQHSDIPQSLGCELTEQGFIKIDAMQQTTIPGVIVCGDNVSPMRSVANAVATGNFAGAVVNSILCQEQF
jgi:thioredoxin reductase